VDNIDAKNFLKKSEIRGHNEQHMKPQNFHKDTRTIICDTSALTFLLLGSETWTTNHKDKFSNTERILKIFWIEKES
jgi:hypothetical protein